MFCFVHGGGVRFKCVRYKSGGKEKWKPVQFVAHNGDQMARYVGEYYSADMESVYRLSAMNGKLFIQFNYGRKRWLLPTLPDTFITMNERISGMVVSFSRDDSGDITGFGLDFDRIKALRFEKRIAR